MNDAIFHIFLNTPIGRENLLQTAYFAKMIQCERVSVFIPPSDECVVYCDNSVITIDLDQAYVQNPETAKSHVDEIFRCFEIPYEIFSPASFTGGSISDVPNDWLFFASPRELGDKSNRVGLGSFGRKVRSLLMHAACPLFITAGAWKPWDGVTVLFSGSPPSARAIEIGWKVAERARTRLNVVTHLIQHSREDCEQTLVQAGLENILDNASWTVSDTGSLEENLYQVPHDSLVVLGTGQHSLMEDLVRKNNLAKIQSLLPNPLVVCGPKAWL